MALAKVQFNRGRGGLGRVRAGADHISALLFYNTKPASFHASGVEVFFSVQQAEGKGITDTAYPVEHYHISEFFRINPTGQLYVGIFTKPAVIDFTEIEVIKRHSQGEVRQIGAFVTDTYSTGLVSALNSVVKNLDQEAPCSAILTADISGTIDLTTLPDIKAGNNHKVTVDIAQSGEGTGADLFESKGFTIGTVGAMLGTVAVSEIHESISYVGKYDVSGRELDVIGFGNGDLYTDKTRTELDALDDKGYVFLIKYPGYVGSFWNSSSTANTGDYGSIEKNRAIDKAVRLVRGAMLPRLNSPVYVNPDGTLREGDINSFEALCNAALDIMLNAGELSAGQVTINPNQNILANDTLEIAIQLVPVGVARTIEINIGFTAQIS